MTRGYVCAFNRNRDWYEVAVALEEASLLECLVTDYYRPDRPTIIDRILPEGLRKRQHPMLSSTRTRNVVSSFLLQGGFQAARLPLGPLFPLTDRLIAYAAGREARRRNCHVYAYAGYTPPRWMRVPGKTVVFQYHPHPGLVKAILADDFAKYPQVAWSFRNEADSTAEEDSARHNDWKLADAVLCASTMTKRSLIHAGCPSERIEVIPYGFAPRGAVTASKGRTCEFLFVGQGIQRKGLHHLLTAWKQAKLPDARLTLVCYRIDPGIRAMVDDPSVRLLPKQSDEALRALYAGSDVFVLPALVEGFGLVYQEALAEGCYVIGTENTGLPDLSIPADCGQIVEAGNITAIVQALQDTAAWHQAGKLDRHRIVDFSRQRPWSQFRLEIAAHAARMSA